MAKHSFVMNEFQGSRLIARDLTDAIGDLLLTAYGEKTYSYTADTNALVNPVDGPGVLVGVIVTVLKAAAIAIYDSASAASGTVIFALPASATLNFYPCHCPFENGITFQAAATYPGMTLIYTSKSAAN